MSFWERAIADVMSKSNRLMRLINREEGLKKRAGNLLGGIFIGSKVSGSAIGSVFALTSPLVSNSPLDGGDRDGSLPTLLAKAGGGDAGAGGDGVESEDFIGGEDLDGGLYEDGGILGADLDLDADVDASIDGTVDADMNLEDGFDKDVDLDVELDGSIDLDSEVVN